MGKDKAKNQMDYLLMQADEASDKDPSLSSFAKGEDELNVKDDEANAEKNSKIKAFEAEQLINSADASPIMKLDDISNMVNIPGKVNILDVELPVIKNVNKGDNTKEVEPNINLLMDVKMTLTVELGRNKMLIKEMLALGEGSIIELDKLAGEPVDLLVNSKLIAKGEVVVIDENFGVRVTDIVAPSERIKSERKEAF